MRERVTSRLVAAHAAASLVAVSVAIVACTDTGRVQVSLDRVFEEFASPKFADAKARRLAPPIDVELPGLGQFYCFACARYLGDAHALETHNAARPHKRRVKELNAERPYGLDEEEVRGMKTDNGPPRATMTE